MYYKEYEQCSKVLPNGFPEENFDIIKLNMEIPYLDNI